ncbi:hypothetical protein GCM10020227_16590 [Streptomyces flavovirens]
MTVKVRDLLPADAEDFVRVRRAALPYMVTTAEQVVRDLADAPPDRRYRLLVAEEDGEVIGTAQVGVAHESPVPGQGFCTPYTHPDHRGRGAGSLLVRTAEEYLAGVGATSVHTWVLDEPANRAFAAKRGYEPRRRAHFLRLDLAHGTLPPLPDLPAGVELRTGADFAGARCSRRTRRRRRTNRPTSPRSCPTTRTGWPRHGTGPPWTTASPRSWWWTGRWRRSAPPRPTGRAGTGRP